MISPISANQINNIRNYSLKKQPAFSSQNYSADNKQISQANFPYYVPFKNLSKPIDITDRYNIDVEDKNHLKFPDMRIYEHPDTNLRLVIDRANKIKIPMLEIELNPNNIEYDPVLSKLVTIIMQKRLDNVDFAFEYTDEKNAIRCSYGYYDTENIGKMNMHILTTDYSMEELNNAKKELINYYHSDYYKDRNADLKYFYPEEAFLSEKEFVQKVNNVDIKALKQYQNDRIKNSYATLYATIPEEEYDGKKTILFSEFNKNINIKFKINNSDNQKKLSDDVYNKKMVVLEDAREIPLMELNYISHIKDYKETFINDIVNQFIEKDSSYTVYGMTYETPFDIKPNYDREINTCHNIWIEKTKWAMPEEELQMFEKHLQKILSDNLSGNLQNAKEEMKRYIMYDIIQDPKTMGRCNLVKDYKEIHNIYKTIENITEQDIINFVNKNYLHQKPIIRISNPEFKGKN